MVIGVCHVAGGLDELDTGGLAQAEVLGVFHELAYAEIIRHGVEENVAGVLQRLGDVVVAVSEVVLRIDPALGGVALVGVFGEHAVAEDLRFGVDDVLREAGNGRAGLEGGARRIGAQERPVEERVIFGGGDLVVILQQGGEVIGGVAGDGQGLSGLDVHDDYGPALYVLADVVRPALGHGLEVVLVSLELEGLYARFEDPLHGLLQLYVYRQVDVVAGVLGIYRAGHGAGGGPLDCGLAVRAVQPVLKGELNAVLADLGVVVVGTVFLAGAVFFHIRVGHGLDVAQDVRGVLRVVFADVGGLHFHHVADHAHEVRDEVYGGVLYKDIGVGVDGVADVHGVAHAGYLAHLLCVVAPGDIVARAEVAHELHGGGVLVQAFVLQVGVQEHTLDIRHVGVFKGRLLGDGQVVCIFVPGGLDHVYHLEYDGVRVLHLVRKEPLVAYLEVVALPVGDEHSAVAVQYIPAGGGDGLFRALFVLALLVIGGALNYLELIEGADAQRQQRHDEQPEGEEPACTYKFFHSLSFRWNGGRS